MPIFEGNIKKKTLWMIAIILSLYFYEKVNVNKKKISFLFNDTLKEWLMTEYDRAINKISRIERVKLKRVWCGNNIVNKNYTFLQIFFDR